MDTCSISIYTSIIDRQEISLIKEHKTPLVERVGAERFRTHFQCQLREASVLILVIFTIFSGFGVSTTYSQQGIPLIIALGLSAIAISILHFGKILKR